MDLGPNYVQLIARLSRRRAQATAILDDQARGVLHPWELRFLGESLLSNIWLDWNNFVKHVLVVSCAGSSTRANLPILARTVADNTEARIRHEFKRYSKGRSPAPGTVDNGQVEPTWAHPDYLVTCLTGLAPSNVVVLQGAFGSGGLAGSRRIHLVRNACAHKSKANRVSVKGLRALYRTPHFMDPVDILWGKSAANGIAIYEWILDLETMADLATA